MFTFKSDFTTGIIGFGAFGRLAANHLCAFTNLKLHDPAYGEMQLDNGQSVANSPIPDIAKCDFIILATPVDQIRTICRKISPHLTPGTTVIDTGSVKIDPLKTMQAELPDFIEILGTHPMFGPQSAKCGLKNHQIALCPTNSSNHRRIATFLKRKLSLQIITMSPEQHDQEAATVQGITHLIATVLHEMKLPKTRISTTSYALLNQSIGMIRDDASCVLNAIEQANPYAAKLRDEFFSTAEKIRSRFAN